MTRTELDEIIAKYTEAEYSTGLLPLEGENPFDLILNVEVKESNRLNLAYISTATIGSDSCHTKIRFNNSLNSMFDITND